jgi:hypothetical protein
VPLQIPSFIIRFLAGRSFAAPFLATSKNRRVWLEGAGIMTGMTLVEITYELQSALNQEQLTSLGSFANTYGLRKFRVDDDKKHLSFEYDASRLRETEVAHVLRQARIPVTRKVN